MPRKAQNRQTENKRNRVPVSGLRDILKVYGKDTDNFYYRFVKDLAEGGMRIHQFLEAGYEFVEAGEHSDIKVGDQYVYKSKKSEGSIVRYPVETDKHGNAQFLFLMKQPMEYYLEDQKLKYDHIDELEAAIHGVKSDDASDPESLGRYGSIKIERKALR